MLRSTLSLCSSTYACCVFCTEYDIMIDNLLQWLLVVEI